MAEPAFEPEPDPPAGVTGDSDAPSPSPSPADAEDGLDRDVEVATAPELSDEPPVADEPEAPVARRGVLPPPKSDGKRAHPLGTRRKRTDDAPKRPSASGLPSGMRAPGVPGETEAENTDILIASAVAALTEGDPAQESSMLLSAEPPAAAATSATSQPVPSPTPQPASEDRKRPAFLWFGVAALAAAVVVALAVSVGEDDDPQPTSVTAEVAPTTPQAAQQANPGDKLAVATPPAPEPAEVPAADIPPDVGEAWVEIDDSVDVGGAAELGDALDLGSVAVADDEPEPVSAAADADEDPSQGGTQKGSRRGKRRRKPKEPAQSTPRPAPTAPTKQPQDAATLLADARKALASGQARKAYSLASKSRSAKRTSAALVVMAKAACRFGGASQAKSAFNQLSVSNRRGLRAECRTHGVRLGI